MASNRLFSQDKTLYCGTPFTSSLENQLNKTQPRASMALFTKYKLPG